jgi:putative membrane protein
MRNWLSISLVCLFAGTAAVGQIPGVANRSMPTSDAAPVERMAFVAKAGAGDLYEIQSSQLAATRSRDARVKEFAQMMIRHHTMTTREVAAAARAAGLRPPPPQLEAAQREMLAQLRPLSGTAFDRAYVSQQKQAHAMALTLHQTYAAQGDVPSLQAAAAKAVPIVQQHIDQLQGM